MKEIKPEVKAAILDFVEAKQSFISLDVYCLLGIRIEDEEYPIHQQVRDAWQSGLMPNYLSEWVHLSLEGGGYANVWRYYLPQVEVQTFPVLKRADGRAELSREILGHFPLLDVKMEVETERGKVKLLLAGEKADGYVVDTAKRVRLPASILKDAALAHKDILIAKVYPNRIEIIGQ